MIEEFVRYWWLPLLRGLALVIFGLLALFLANNMSVALTEILVRVSLTMLFALYLGLSGSLIMWTAALIRHASHRWAYIAHGLVLIALCVVIVVSPGVRLETVVLLTVIHAAINGAGEARIAFALSHHRKEAVLLGIMAGLSFSACIALVLLRNGPVAPMTATLGAYTLTYGSCLAYFGWHMRKRAISQ